VTVFAAQVFDIGQLRHQKDGFGETGTIVPGPVSNHMKPHDEIARDGSACL
jgi:hypothetical protein